MPAPHNLIVIDVQPPRRVAATQCLRWFQAGWKMLIAHPLEWVLMSLAAFGMLMIAALFFGVPVLGQVLAPMILVLLVAGMLHAAQRQADGRTPKFTDLFEGLRQQSRPLLILGGLFSLPLVLMVTLGYIAILAGVLLGIFSSALGEAVQGVIDSLHTLVAVVLGTGLTFLAIWSLLLLALLFAPALVMFCRQNAWVSLKLSFAASLHNFWAMLLFAVALYALFTLAMLPAGLGILILIPVSIGAIFQAYQDILGAPTSSPSVDEQA